MPALLKMIQATSGEVHLERSLKTEYEIVKGKYK